MTPGLAHALQRLDARLARLLSEGSEGELPDTLAGDDYERLNLLRERYGLSQLECDVLLMALAVEVESRYGQAYSCLQNDALRSQPSVQLILNALCDSPAQRLAARERFHPSAPLSRWSLVRLMPDADVPLSAREVVADEGIVNYLLGSDAMDPRLASFCSVVAPETGSDALPAFASRLPQVLSDASRDNQALTLYLQGHAGMARELGVALANHVDAPCFVVDLPRAVTSAHALDAVLGWVRREAWLFGALRYFHGCDVLRGTQEWDVLCSHLRRNPGIAMAGGTAEWVRDDRAPDGLLVVPVKAPGYADRREVWQRASTEFGLKAAPDEVDRLASSFHLSGEQIRGVAAAARNEQMWKPDGETAVQRLSRAARHTSGHELAALARRLEPVATWDDLVLPDEALTQLHELCQRVALRERVMSEWGFERRYSGGKGANALFAGVSGTGKTMAAEVVASDLQLAVFKIDLAGVVSKYIGETEKNLDRIFRAAQGANAILFFDEADALFGKRSEVRDSHDRYANLEISYLLQKMEEYDGIAILATNLRQNMDEAFVRRLAFTITFPFPDAASREQIWRLVWPASAPLAEDIDFRQIAAQFQLSGGNIRNVALAAAFDAAATGGRIEARHVVHAIGREYGKLGRPLDASEIAIAAGRVA